MYLLGGAADWTVDETGIVVVGHLLATTVAVLIATWVEVIVLVTVAVDGYIVKVSARSEDIGP